MPTEQQRAKFEAWICSQPRDTPGYAIETAWAAWQAALQAQQPGAQAVAWHTDDHLTDKSATTYDPVIADRWRAKGWPVTPHYTDPQPPSIPEPSEDDVEAAKDAFDDVYDGMPGSDRPSLRAALATYTARLRERIGGGV